MEGIGYLFEGVFIQPRPSRIKKALPDTINPTARSNPQTLRGSKFALRTKTGLSIIELIIALSMPIDLRRSGNDGDLIVRMRVIVIELDWYNHLS